MLTTFDMYPHQEDYLNIKILGEGKISKSLFASFAKDINTFLLDSDCIGCLNHTGDKLSGFLVIDRESYKSLEDFA